MPALHRVWAHPPRPTAQPALPLELWVGGGEGQLEVLQGQSFWMPTQLFSAGISDTLQGVLVPACAHWLYALQPAAERAAPWPDKRLVCRASSMLVCHMRALTRRSVSSETTLPLVL